VVEGETPASGVTWSDGSRLWFGGMEVSPAIIRRLVAYGHGFHPFGR
jgi:hypothetical protein